MIDILLIIFVLSILIGLTNCVVVSFVILESYTLGRKDKEKTRHLIKAFTTMLKIKNYS